MDTGTMVTDKEKVPFFMKLFGHDPEGKLKKIRDNIYSHVWSRDRRDDAKLDWVLSQYGVNRNVPERFIEDTPYGSAMYKSSKELRCGLILANKEVSADFARYIYSANELEVDVDLKAIHTALNEAKLHKILTLLQNPNLVRYSRVVRVRIHFPEKYPFQELPAFNRHALEDIAMTLDGFEQIEHLNVRIVPMQGPKDYELRFATFPFYAMSFTTWSISILNDTTSMWDVVGGEQVHNLDQAWDIYQATGSLTALVDTVSADHKSVPHAKVPDKRIASLSKKPTTIQNKNGSQKRRDRKRRAVSDTCTDTESASTTPNVIASSRPSSPVPAPLQHNQPTFPPGTELLKGHTESKLEPSDRDPSGAPKEERSSASKPSAVCTVGPSRPPSPPLSLSNLGDMDPAMDISTSDTSGEVVMTPSVSSVASPADHDTIAITQVATKVDGTVKSKGLMESKSPQKSCPRGPMSSPTAPGGNQDVETCSTAAMASSGAASSADEQDKNQMKKKKRKNRKKPKKSKAGDTTITWVDDNGKQLHEDGGAGNQNDIDFTEENQVDLENLEEGQGENGNRVVHRSGKLDVPLSELADLKPCHGGLCVGTRTDGSRFLMPKTREAERNLRQRERLAANQREREAEKMKNKEKRQSKMAKQTLIRRRDPSLNLRHQTEDGRHQRLPTSSSDPKIAPDEPDHDAEDNSKDQQHHTTPSTNHCDSPQGFFLPAPSASNPSPTQNHVGYVFYSNRFWEITRNPYQQETDQGSGSIHLNNDLWARPVPMNQGYHQDGQMEEQHSIGDLGEAPDAKALVSQCAADDDLFVPQDD